jgi:hypothetical protein
MEALDFYNLPRTAQERFVGSVNGSGLPAPILRTATRPLAPYAWMGASVAAFILLLLLLLSGYGSLTSSLARQGPLWLIVEMAMLGASVFAALRAAEILHAHRSSPWKRGVYVFPVGLIDATKSSLLLYPIEDLSGVTASRPGEVRLDFTGASFAFPADETVTVESIRAALDGARSSMGEAGAARESVRPKALAALDPLRGYANPLSSPDKMTPSAPEWTKLAWGIAVGVGVMIGFVLWMVRNMASDEAMFKSAYAANDVASYNAYVAQGSRHVIEVQSVLLPRALLRDAEKAGTVEAIEAFIRDHKEPAVAREAANARRVALLAELDVATKAGTLAALIDFTQRHPDSGLTAEIGAARHAVYAAALAKYGTVAPDKAPASTAFVERLLAWTEKNGPPVDLRFHRRHDKTIDKADSAVGKSREFRGVVSLPSHYLDDAAEKADVDALSAAIVQKFADVFPPEILAVAVADPIADPDAPLPTKVTRPTLFIEHGASWGGSTRASQKPKGVFVGLELGFDATFRMPDDTKPVKVHVAGWHVPDISVAKDSDTPEVLVYTAMRAKAFDQFKTKLLATFFHDVK